MSNSTSGGRASGWDELPRDDKAGDGDSRMRPWDPDDVPSKRGGQDGTTS